MRLWIVASCVGLLSGCAGRSKETAADAVEPKVAVEHRREAFGYPEKLDRVHISNRYGDLRIRNTDKWEIGMQAVIQRIGEQPREPHFEVQKDARSFDLRIRFGDDADDAPVDTQQGRVDLVVFVPPSVELEVETDSGTLQVRRFRGPVKARTQSGQLEVSGFGALDLATDAGKMIARQLETGFDGTSTLHSRTGRIEIGLPTKGNYLADLQAAGGVEVHLAWGKRLASDAVTAPGQRQLKRGAGTTRIQVHTGGSLQIAPVEILE
jgi:hypothetical protein